LGSSQQAVDALCSKARDALRRFSCLHGIAGLSPHAPYTTHPDVLQCAVNLSAAHFAPLAMHLAESTEELELLRTRTGAFVELLQKLNAWNPDSLVHRKPMGYLEQLVGSARALVIHGNYLDDEEIAFVAAHREQLSVVYCPRTHAYFGHSRYPLTKMLNAGVRVVIGTDSRASNPDLSLFEELRYLATTFPEVNPETILRMGTVNGADALGISDTYGAVTENRLARFAVAQITTATNDPYEALWTSAHIHSL
jgi:cytosine/adenosine deaminase-related metal-dependent hydrolase